MAAAPTAFLQRPDERTPAPVAQSWQRLEDWYAANVPEVLKSLRPGVAEHAFCEIETVMQVTLPHDVKESLRIHDGQDRYSHPGAILGLRLKSLSEIRNGVEVGRKDFRDEEASDVTASYEEYTSFPCDAIRCCYGNPFWLPMAGDEGGSVGIDLDPATNGSQGQVINFGNDQENKFVLALGWAQLLEDMADELERGTIVAIRDEEGSVNFSRAGNQEQGIWWYYRAWSEAKLPSVFQCAPPAEFAPDIPGLAIHDDRANECRTLVERFILDMHAYERKWLEIRPIHKLGKSCVSESPTGHHATGTPGNFNEPESPMPTCEELIAAMGPIRESIDRAVSEHGIAGIMDAGGFSKFITQHLSAGFREHDERMEWGKYRKDGVADWNAIVGRYCTPRKREQRETFVQCYPLRYDPARDQVADVRQVTPEHIVVYLQPDGSRVTRFHLLRHEGRWLIDLKEETTDHIHFRKVSV